MSVKQDYPAREHYNPPNTPVEYMAENRRLYGMGAEMRNFVNGYIHNIYKGEPLYEYFLEISRLLFAQRVIAGVQPPSSNSNEVNHHFLRGTLIALDASIYTIDSESFGNSVLAANPFESMSSDGKCESNAARLLQDSELLKNIDNGLGLEMLRSVEKSFVKEIMDTGQAYYKGIPNKVAHRQDTAVGMLFGFGTVDEIKANLIAGGHYEYSSAEE